MIAQWLWTPSPAQLLTTRFMRNRPLYETLAQRLVPALRAERGRPLRVLVWACASGCEAYTLRAMLAPTDVASIDGADLSADAIAAARDGVYDESAWQSLSEPGRSLLTAVERTRLFEPIGTASGARFRVRDAMRAGVNFWRDDLFADDGGTIALDHYDVVVCNNLLLHLRPASAVNAIARLRRYVLGDGVVVLAGCHPTVRAHAAHELGLVPLAHDSVAVERGADGVSDAWQRDPRPAWAWPPVRDDDPHAAVKRGALFRVDPARAPRFADRLGRETVAICGMPRAGTTFLCAMLAEYGRDHGWFMQSPGGPCEHRLEENSRIDALVCDRGSTPGQLAEVLSDCARVLGAPAELGLACKQPQLVWRPDLLQAFSKVVFAVRDVDDWLRSAQRYRDTVLHAVGPAIWLPPAVQDRLRVLYRGGDFVAEFGRCTAEQTLRLARELPVDSAVFHYGDAAAMRHALDFLGLPADLILERHWRPSERAIAPAGA